MKQKSLPLTATLDNLIYQVSDTLDMPLHKMVSQTSATYKGCEARKYAIGDFWHQNSDWIVESDQTGAGPLSFLVRTKANLWMYIISSHNGLWIQFFDGDRAKIKSTAIGEFKTGSINQTLAKLKGATRDGYQFIDSTKGWTPHDVMASLG